MAFSSLNFQMLLSSFCQYSICSGPKISTQFEISEVSIACIRYISGSDYKNSLSENSSISVTTSESKLSVPKSEPWKLQSGHFTFTGIQDKPSAFWCKTPVWCSCESQTCQQYLSIEQSSLQAFWKFSTILSWGSQQKLLTKQIFSKMLPKCHNRQKFLVSCTFCNFVQILYKIL